MRLVGYSKIFDRQLFLSEISDVRKWSPHLSHVPSPFIVVTAFDSTAVDEEALLAFAERLIARGCRYSCTWGPDSSRLDLAFDLAAIDAGLDGQTDSSEFVMTSDHGDEPLDEALWFALHVASPADPTPECHAVLAITSPGNAVQVERRFADVESLNRDVLAQEPPIPHQRGRGFRLVSAVAWFLIVALVIAALKSALARVLHIETATVTRTGVGASLASYLRIESASSTTPPT